MSSTSEEGVEVVSGEIVQISASMVQSDVENSNIGKMYPFIMINTGNGEVLKINNIVVDAHIEQHLNIGKSVTLYLKQVRHLTNFKKMNFAVAVTSDIGAGIMDLPSRVVRGMYSVSIFLGVIGGAIVSFVMIPVVGWTFNFIANILIFITGLYFLQSLMFVGAFIGFLCGPALLIYLLRSAGRFAKIRSTAERLRKKLNDNYCGMTVRNI